MGPTEETRSSEARKLGRWVLAAVLGGGLALGSAIFAWIVASALSR